MSVVKAERFAALKAKVKAEMLRRNQSGSVASYGGTAYDYTAAPAAGRTVRREHRDKLIEPMRAVNSDVIPAARGVISESELQNLETRAAVWAARSITDKSGSDCKSGCAGTCYTGCATGCSGCSGSCSGGCSGCGSGCPDGCSSCPSGCSGCSGCGSGCPGGCSGCGSGCPGGCSGCGSGCPSGCSGCGNGSCGVTCGHSCKVTCGSSVD